MPRNSLAQYILKYPIVYVVVAALCAISAFKFNNWMQIEPEKIIQSSIFLGGLYLLLYFVFFVLQKKSQNKAVIIFLILLVVKFTFIFGFLFFIFNPQETGNNNVIVLFLITYLVLQIADIVIKIRLLKY